MRHTALSDRESGCHDHWHCVMTPPGLSSRAAAPTKRSDLHPGGIWTTARRKGRDTIESFDFVNHSI